MRIFACLFGLLAVTSGHAATEKFRLLWNQNPSATVTVAWCHTGSGDPGSVHYGTEDHGQDWAAYPQQHGVDRETRYKELHSAFARLKGLEPDTRYYFVVKDADGVSPRFWFRTAPDEAASFSFVAGGDSRNHRDARLRANRTVSKLRPLFICFGGDMIDKSTPQSWSDWFDDWQQTFGEDGRIFPLIAARGNHEQSADIHQLFDTPHPQDYYAVDFGNGYLRIYTLNSTIVRDGEQGAWLREDLARNEGAHWKIAHYHHPFRPHVASKTEQYAQYNAWAKPFYDHGMNLVIECDSHAVKRTWPVRPSNEPGSEEGFIRDDAFGTVFIGEGCWGAPLRPANDAKSWTRDSGSFNQVNWIHVTPEQLKVHTVLVDEVEGFGTVDDATPLQAPEGIRFWEPDNGTHVVIRPWGEGPHPAVDPATLGRLEIVVAPPKFNRSAEIRIEKVELPQDCEIRYTLDGSDPTAKSKRYDKPFEIRKPATIRATAFVEGKPITAPSEAKAERRGPATGKKG